MCIYSNLTLEREIFSAGTDSCYLRMVSNYCAKNQNVFITIIFNAVQLNIPALGFSSINNTPILLHDHNEFLNEETVLCGINIY